MHFFTKIRYVSVTLMMVAAQPVFADYWVSIAVNKKVGQHGNSFFLETQSAAKTSALAHCKQFSNGADGCEIVLVTKQCSGMAHAGPNIYVSEGRTAGLAGSMALKSCKATHGGACRIHETFCPNK